MTSQAQKLLCPRDGSELEIRRWQDSEFGFCTRCHGMLIERPELDALSHSEGPPLTYPDDPPDGVDVKEGPTLCSCPGQPLMDRVNREGDLSIDVCPVCQAVWFDAGEVHCYLAARQDVVLGGLGAAMSLPRAIGELLLDLFSEADYVAPEDRPADPRIFEREDV
jgi:Zn-finger nucleic acid-binding protein